MTACGNLPGLARTRFTFVLLMAYFVTSYSLMVATFGWGLGFYGQSVYVTKLHCLPLAYLADLERRQPRVSPASWRRARGATRARVHEELVAVAEDLGRLNDSIGDLLDFSRLESDAWRPASSCTTYAISSARSYRGSQPLRPRGSASSSAEDLPEIQVDFAQMARALSNLVENALLYSPQRTRSWSARDPCQAPCSCGSRTRVPGFPTAEKPHVFEKFYRGSASGSVPSGTGLGLAIAREIVRTHGGTLRVEDCTARRRTLRACRSRDARRRHRDPRWGARRARSGSSSSTTRSRFGARSSPSCGARHYEVDLAETAEAGLELTATRTPDIIVLDLTLPGMSGLEACRRAPRVVPRPDTDPLGAQRRRRQDRSA